jgi:gamma-glutamylaminecyclotransferase
MMRYRIFVYGTLKKGFPNHDNYMKSARELGRYETIEKYPLVLCGKRNVPCMIFSPGEGHHVEGEVYEIDDDGLNGIDALERTRDSDGYRRYVIRVSSSGWLSLDIIDALAYLMPPEQIIDCRSSYLKTYNIDDAKKYMPRK